MMGDMTTKMRPPHLEIKNKTVIINAVKDSVWYCVGVVLGAFGLYAINHEFSYIGVIQLIAMAIAFNVGYDTIIKPFVIPWIKLWWRNRKNKFQLYSRGGHHSDSPLGENARRMMEEWDNKK